MKKTFFTLFVIFSCQIGFSQIDTTGILTHASNKGNIMLDAFQTGDYDTFMDYTHPKIIRLSGGREKMKKMLSQGIAPGVEILSTEITLPNRLIITDISYQCVFPQKQIMSINGQKIYTLGSLIGVSYDKGESWMFIGVAHNTLANLRELFPELSDELSVKLQTEPVLVD